MVVVNTGTNYQDDICDLCNIKSTIHRETMPLFLQFISQIHSAFNASVMGSKYFNMASSQQQASQTVRLLLPGLVFVETARSLYD